MSEQKHTAETVMDEMLSISPIKHAMNTAFAESVLMFAVMDLDKNGAKEPSDYMTPMLTAIKALKNEFSEEELCEMMAALAHVAKGMFGTSEIEA
jgi:hypothetical protein